MDSTLDTLLLRISTKLHRIHRSGLTAPGSYRHDFHLLPRACDDDVRALERRLGATLPGPFRGFLTQLGNGGAGPFGGLVLLDDRVELRGGGVVIARRPGRAQVGSEEGAVVLGLRGEHRGRLSYVDPDGTTTTVGHPDVLSWYESWLDAVLSGNDAWTGLEPPSRTRPASSLETQDLDQRWMPHSDLPEPAQRPSRPLVEGDVQGLHPIDG